MFYVVKIIKIHIKVREWHFIREKTELNQYFIREYRHMPYDILKIIRVSFIKARFWKNIGRY